MAAGLLRRRWRAYVEKKALVVREIDLKRIYPENVRAFFGVTTGFAKRLLDLGVKEGWLEKRVGYLSPISGRMIAAFPIDQEPPEVLYDEQAGAFDEEAEFAPDDLRTEVFYSYLPTHG